MLAALYQINQLDAQGVNWQYFIRALLNSVKQEILTALEKAQSTNKLSELLRLVASVYSQLKDFPSPKLALETEILLKINSEVSSEDSVVKLESITPAVKTEQVKSVKKEESSERNQRESQPINEPQQEEPKVENAEESAKYQRTMPKTTEAAIDLTLDLEKFTKLLKPKLALYPVIKQIKLDWQNGKLVLHSETSAQTAVLRTNLAVIKQTIKSLVGKDCEVELIASNEEQKASIAKANTATSIREEQTNAKLVEELF